MLAVLSFHTNIMTGDKQAHASSCFKKNKPIQFVIKFKNATCALKNYILYSIRVTGRMTALREQF